MKNRTHVIIIISIVLLVMLGGWLAYCGIYKQTLGPDTYYTLQEAKWLLDRLKPEETVTSDEEDMKGFTVEDAKQGLQQILNMSESQVEEELNIEIKADDLRLITKFKTGNVWMMTYILRGEYNIAEMKFQESEVADAKWATFEEVDNLVKNGKFIKNRWEFVSDIIKKEIKI